ncbi:short-chain dehydrogenase/reductase SDR [Pseudarthrobacter chlorophenolicus A6]|uniref:Short-chain dehydrogenase/reductase SDR n=1 Tax=Pseudarthrobacter chlorophenolicus (strain ATCC 700700 / DSM 12829 / CIP 107037 / JCM 12360 / KCTC 9906 / NCIMB 13794 / A6) TaxID=452863 RepID=B8HC46_PSECP|nr:SDR family NAD(P)-dependent oxidoreductase [Pseudarthrobacter chlorophenolicus]ACL38756.1 short-chain dehydrogenase/reductase SDR [Pseudarthrobacter chlorophenolicus A6]SDR09194.1 NADP-dependent 3-hydroxy acid dehydrogenase YdfG [Pseudarthrobacter chlorophenolicus]
MGNDAAWQENATPGRFSGRTVIVTGAGSGIGQATALRIAREGGRVIAADISKQRLDDLVADNPGLDLVPVAGDISTEETVAAVIAAAGGRVDALANIAGIMDNFAPIHEVDDELWDRVFRINVTALMRLTRAVVPLMLEAGGGSVVNVASEAGLRGSAAGAAYTASKHAVVGLTKNSAVMYGPRGLRFNAVVPGATITNIEANWGSELAAGRLGPLMQANIPAPATAAQLAASITFLLSEDGTNVNGAILASDGGWSAV